MHTCIVVYPTMIFLILLVLCINVKLNVLHTASTYDVPDEVVDTLDRVAKAVASRASEVGVAYSSRKMIDVYSATGTFADW